MKNFFCHLLFLSILSIPLMQTGCASMATWNATGIETFKVKSSKIDKLDKRQIQLIQNGTLIKNYFPFISIFSISNTENKVYTYPTDKRTSDSLFFHFYIQPISNIPKVGKKQSIGLLSFSTNNIDCFQKNKVNQLNTEESAYLRRNPFILQMISVNDVRLLIPYKSELQKDGIISLYAYSPLVPPVIIPDSFHESYHTKMSGIPITLWRIFLMPIPVFYDLITSPLQLILLLCVH